MGGRAFVGIAWEEGGVRFGEKARRGGMRVRTGIVGRCGGCAFPGL